MSNTNMNRLRDPKVDADAALVEDADEPRLSRLGDAPAPGIESPEDAPLQADASTAGTHEPRAGGVEGLDERRAEAESRADVVDGLGKV